jgi:hypothetical protein
MQKPNSGRTHQRTGLDKREAHPTKRGPGRRHKAGNPGNRIAKPRKVRAYIALMAAWASKRITKAKHRDERGAFTFTGTADRYEWVVTDERDGSGYRQWIGRRKWLAGISAQRGY